MSHIAFDLPIDRFAPKSRADRLDHTVRDELEAMLETRAPTSISGAPKPAARPAKLCRSRRLLHRLSLRLTRSERCP
jgi:hypothetical protein